MQRSVRTSILGLQIGLTLLIGLFVALGANGILASVLIGLTPAGGAPPAPSTAEAEGAADEVAAHADNALLYNRNLSNQAVDTPAPVEAEDTEALDPAAELAEEQAIHAALGAPVPSDVRFLLVGTQVAEPAEYSLAILKDLDGGPTDDAIYRRVGASFLNEDATIVAIDRKRVFFQRHSERDRIEYIDIDTTAADVAGRARKAEAAKVEPEKAKARTDNAAEKQAATPEVRPTKVASVGAVDPSAIELLEPDTYGIPRDMAEQVRLNPKIMQDPKFGQPPQIQPVYKGGAVNGFRVLGVDPNSVYGKLGIENGDIILDVNGQIVDNPQKALSFFDKLGPDADVAIKVNRRGRPKSLTYKLK